MYFDNLPAELLEKTMMSLDYDGVKNLSKKCDQAKRISDNPMFWYAKTQKKLAMQLEDYETTYKTLEEERFEKAYVVLNEEKLVLYCISEKSFVLRCMLAKKPFSGSVPFLRVMVSQEGGFFYILGENFDNSYTIQKPARYFLPNDQRLKKLIIFEKYLGELRPHLEFLQKEGVLSDVVFCASEH